MRKATSHIVTAGSRGGNFHVSVPGTVPGTTGCLTLALPLFLKFLPCQRHEQRCKEGIVCMETDRSGPTTRYKWNEITPTGKVIYHEQIMK